MAEDILSVIHGFTASLLNPFDSDLVLHNLTASALDLLHAQGCGIMLADDDGELAFAAASNDDVVTIERHQEHAHEGACFEAFHDDRIVRVSTPEEAEQRWPRYAQRLADAGLRSVLGVPLHAFGSTIGVMNVYRDTAAPWSTEDVTAAQILGALGASAVVYSSDVTHERDLATQLRSAITSRDTIGQAKGILMEREQVDADAAFALLRDISQRSNRKLREVAAAIVEQHRGPTHAPA